MRYFHLFLFVIIITFHAMSVKAEMYMSKPLYEDINLSKIQIHEEKEILTLLENDPITKNVVINYLKSLVYNKGMVSKTQYDTFQERLANLSDPKKQRIYEIVSDYLKNCGCKFIVIDIKGGDYYLPYKPIEANQ